MKRVLISSLPSPNQNVSLPDDEAHHLLQVLRARNGEEIECLDGAGKKTKAIIELQGKGKAILISSGLIESDPKLMSVPIQLEMAIIKGDAMEWTVEKAVELGVRTFVPVQTAHAVVQIEKKGPKAFQERWQKIADQALKQCGRLERMTVAEPLTLEALLMTKRPLRLWLDEASRATSPSIIEALHKSGAATITQGVSILVGPEGGWSETERQLLTRMEVPSVSLGPWVLRAETAALFATGTLFSSMQ